MDQLVFISYTSADRDLISRYYDHLFSKGFNIWVDYKKLKAGQNWDFEIRRALSKASIIIIFISNNSVTKRGYVQREIKLALNKYEEKLSEDIYVVPVVLDDDAAIPDILYQRPLRVTLWGFLRRLSLILLRWQEDRAWRRASRLPERI